MHLFLIRHGESTDNAAGLLAGSRNATLTAHGVLQAKRLASFLVESKLDLKHVFSSTLQRASKTAQAISDAQKREHKSAVEVLQLPELREKHFGNWEGMKSASDSSAQRPPQSGAETREQIKARLSSFLDEHLEPCLLKVLSMEPDSSVVVVSHGITLGSLTTTLMERFNHATPGSGGPGQLLSPGFSWSNTGYLELILNKRRDADPATTRTIWSGVDVKVAVVNGTSHLKGLHRTRGGIGSAAFDEKQTTLEGFLNVSRKRASPPERSAPKR